MLKVHDQTTSQDQSCKVNALQVASLAEESFTCFVISSTSNPKMHARNCIKIDPPLKERSSLPHFKIFRSEDSNGILWFELQRELESIYYQRIDFVDAACACLSHKLAPWSFAVFVVYQSPGLGRHPETDVLLQNTKT